MIVSADADARLRLAIGLASLPVPGFLVIGMYVAIIRTFGAGQDDRSDRSTELATTGWALGMASALVLVVTIVTGHVRLAAIAVACQLVAAATVLPLFLESSSKRDTLIVLLHGALGATAMLAFLLCRSAARMARLEESS